jgi:hypothetical protein
MILLNNQQTMQPSTLQEYAMPIQTDVVAIDGSTQRNFQGVKYQANLSFMNLTVSGYQQIMGIINTGLAVTYSNNLSAATGGSLSISGLVTFTPSPYVRGASLYQQLDFVVRQV